MLLSQPLPGALSPLLAPNPMEPSVRHRLDELQQVIETSRSQRDAALHSLAYRLRGWRTHVRKRACMYSVLNMWNFDLARRVLIAEAWCPVTQTEVVQTALRRATARSGAMVPSIVNLVRD